MKWSRVYAVILRILFMFRHSLDRIVDVFYWPMLDLFLLGLTSLYFVTISGNKDVLFSIISAILLWLIIYRGQYEISGNLLTDLWDRNLVNMFVTPLKFSEWLAAFMSLGFIKAVISLTFASTIAFFLYHVNILAFGWYLPVFFFLLLFNGWWIGFFVSGLIIRFGTRIQAFAWSLVWVFSPFIALYYPVSILPPWAQMISKAIPGSYVFENARSFIHTGHVNFADLWISLGLNIFYILLGLWYFRAGFKKALSIGLVKLY
jgi:ABC-2 type transport system permease protein